MMNKPDYSLIAKYLKEQASEEEGNRVKSWISDSTENQKEFDQLKKIWEERGKLAASYEPDLDRAWTRIEKGTSNQIMPWIYRVAAVLVLAIGISYLMINWNTNHNTVVAQNTEYTASEEVLEMSLSDGTIITLNKGASISHDEAFGSSERRIQLDGEAFFEVARDENRPFIIETSTTTTQVLGTSFTVNPTEESVIVTVVSGKVSFQDNANRHEVVLTKGEQGSYDNASGALTESMSDDLNFLAWKTGKLVFDDSPIEQVIADLERFYQVKFQLENPSVKNLTSSFDNQSLEEVLLIVSATLDLEIEQQSPNTYYIK